MRLDVSELDRFPEEGATEVSVDLIADLINLSIRSRIQVRARREDIGTAVGISLSQ